MELLLSSRQNIFRVHAENGDVEMEPCFVHPTGEYIKCLAANDDRSHLLAGFFPGGVFRSTDGGALWTNVSAGLPIDKIVNAAIDPTNPDRLYVGTNPAALFVSENGGKAWRELEALRNHPNASIWSNPRGPAHVRGISISPFDSRLIFTAIEVGDLMRSEDGGASWEVIGGVCRDQHKVLLSRVDPNLAFLSTGADSAPYDGAYGYGLFRSRDGGTSFVNVNDRLGTTKSVYTEDAIVSPRSAPETIFLAVGDETPPHWRGPRKENEYFATPSREKREKGADYSIHRSRDGGDTWQTLADAQWKRWPAGCVLRRRLGTRRQRPRR
ncbi:MAG: hypothetical protein HW416_1811 [Chloroflexi bacterium]|nr:hypothetical protein [Chloroflexota bacterium]